MADNDDAPNQEPTEETPSTETAPATEEAPAVPEPSPPAPASGLRRPITFPAWVLGLVALVAVGALGIGIGRWTAPDDDTRGPVIEFPGRFEDGPDLDRNPPGPLPAGDAVLGVTVDDATDPSGAEVERVVDDGPADDAGLEDGDVITAVDGDAVTSAEQLGERIRDHDPGDEVTITYTRDGTSQEVEVTLAGGSDLAS